MLMLRYFFASCVKDTVQGNCNAMYTTGYRYAGIYRQSRVLTVKNNCSIPGRTPRRWWTGPTASATTSRVTATTGSSAPDPTTGNAFAVRTGTYLFSFQTTDWYRYNSKILDLRDFLNLYDGRRSGKKKHPCC